MTAKRKYCAIAALLFAAAVLFGLAFVIGRFSVSGSETPQFDQSVSYREEYGADYTLEIFAANFQTEERTFPATAVLVYDSQNVAILGEQDEFVRYKLEETGEYVLTYFCVIDNVTYTRNFSFRVTDRPYFEYDVENFCKLGEDISLESYASWKGERKQASVSVDGVPYDGEFYHVYGLDAVEITFSAEYDSETYSESITVQPNLENAADLFVGKSGINSVRADVDAPSFMREGNGVEIIGGAPGAKVRYANIINLNALTSADQLALFAPLSGEGYEPLKEVQLRLVDVHDETKYVYWKFYSVHWEEGGCTAYAGFNYDGRTIGRFNESGLRFGEVRSDWMAQLPNATFDYEDSKKTDCMWFGVQADYATRAFYVTTEMPAGMDPWLLLDADDSSQVGVGKEWKGFTTGEVWLEFVFDGSGNSGILVKEIAGQNLSGEKIADTTAPSVITDFALDNDMPVGIVGQAYPIPAPAKILDGVEGILSSSAAEIRLYKTEGILSFDCSDLIENGAFVPKEAGTYRIRYILTDSFGNEGLRDLLVEISSEQQEIIVGCALPQTAFVGETLNLPDVTVEGMTTLTEQVRQYYFNGEKLNVLPGDDYFFEKEGELELKYSFTDYVNNHKEGSYKMQVSVCKDPIITVRGVPQVAISGKDLLLPACTAYDYNFAQGQTGFEPMISVAVNGKTLGEDRKYAVTEKAGSRLEVVYAAGSAKETFYIDVIAPKYLSEYFLKESTGAVTDVNAEDYTGFAFVNDVTVCTSNPSVVDDYAGFPMTFDVAAAAGTLTLRMIDCLRPYKYIEFEVNLAKRTFTINGEGKEYTLPKGQMTLRYREIGGILSGYGVIEKWKDNTTFDGFERGLAYVEWEVKTDGAGELKLYELGLTKLRTAYENGVPQAFKDTGVPSIVLSASVYDQNPVIGQALFVPAAEAYQSLSGACSVTVSLYNASGDKVIDKAIANRDYYYTIDAYGVWLIEYRVVYTDGAVDEKSMPFVVKSAIPPTLDIGGNVPETAKKGDGWTIPSVNVSGVGETDWYVSVIAPDGSIKIYNAGETLQFSQTGIYRITFVGSDDWNYSVENFEISVR